MHRIFSACAATLTACILLLVPSTASAKERSQEPLKPGQTLDYDSNNLHVTFISVPDDSRCPINARCISAGDAKVVIRIKVNGGEAKNYGLHTHEKRTHLIIPGNSGGVGIPKSYDISIAKLSPQPYAGKPTKQRDYRLKLRIETAQ